ncbi:MAG TPA: histidinol-phosphate transaminase [Rubricoccaceae bacterium]|jgi:histidinol-phosphate aminotransferase
MPPLHLVRPAVRAERAYLVPTTTDTGAKLDQNESPFDLPADLKDAILARFAAEPWNRYPDDRPHALTAAITERLGVAPGSVLVGRGSNDLVHSLGLCFLDAGTPVVIPAPTFALFGSVARMHDARVVNVAPRADLSHDADAILAAAQESGAALTVVVTPNNPTGQTVSYDDLDRLAAGVPGILLVDEAYHEFVTGRPALDLLTTHDNVLVMRTFSKAIGLAGIRVGYLVGHPDLIAEMEKARLPFLVDRLAEAVTVEVLARPDLLAAHVATLTAERDRLFAEVTALPGVEAVPSAANFFLFRTPLATADLRAALAARGVLVRDVSGYPELASRDGRPGWLRVSIGTPGENRAFAGALAAVLAEG